MQKSLLICPNRKDWLMYSFLTLFLLGTFVPSLFSVTFISDINDPNLLTVSKASEGLDQQINTNLASSLKLGEISQVEPEAYFPNFLYYSKEIANAMIDHLYDNVSGGFFTSKDQHFQESSVNTEKKTYDNAQAILALLKLADAVINETERDFALEIAEKTGSFMLSELYDTIFGGFLTSQSVRYKRPGIEGKAIQALLSLAEATGNQTYQDYAISTFNFIDQNGWNSTHGYYYYILSHSGFLPVTNPSPEDPYVPWAPRADHNAIFGDALLDLYRIDSNITYLTKAQQIYDFFNSTCRNTTTGLFYTGLNSTNGVVDPSSADIFINSLMLEFLSHLYNVTEDTDYYDDFFLLLNTVLLNFWDQRYGGFHATFSYIDPDLRDVKKYTERQFYGIRALDEAFKLSNNELFYNLILDILEFLNDKLYDNPHGGYYQLINEDGTEGIDSFWKDKFTVTQSLSIYALSNLWLYSKPGVLNALWSPSAPRPQDPVTIFIAAFDKDGISNVLFNYSLNDDPYQIVEMIPNERVGNMYNTSLDGQFDGTRINFNVIVNDTKGVQVVRGNYFFLWQLDIWPPQVLEIGFSPSLEIPVHKEFSITVSAQDIPTQGYVKYVRMYYHRSGQAEKSLPLEHIDVHIWSITFPDGLSTPGTYSYYFESIDHELNVGLSPFNFFYVLGHQESTPFELVIGLVVVGGIFIPAGLYTYVEYKKKGARKTLKGMREVRYRTRSTGKLNKRAKRGTKRT
ncbi:MAG: glycoside hydrolase family 76 protein [Candidatus Hodarchaeales archaeon]